MLHCLRYKEMRTETLVVRSLTSFGMTGSSIRHNVPSTSTYDEDDFSRSFGHHSCV